MWDEQKRERFQTLRQRELDGTPTDYEGIISRDCSFLQTAILDRDPAHEVFDAARKPEPAPQRQMGISPHSRPDRRFRKVVTFR